MSTTHVAKLIYGIRESDIDSITTDILEKFKLEEK